MLQVITTQHTHTSEHVLASSSTSAYFSLFFFMCRCYFVSPSDPILRLLLPSGVRAEEDFNVCPAAHARESHCKAVNEHAHTAAKSNCSARSKVTGVTPRALTQQEGVSHGNGLALHIQQHSMPPP